MQYASAIVKSFLSEKMTHKVAFNALWTLRNRLYVSRSSSSLEKIINRSFDSHLIPKPQQL